MKLAKGIYLCLWWRNTKECLVSENSCSKNFLNFQEKHLSEAAFLNKVAGYLTLAGNVLGNLWNFKNRFHQETKHLRMPASAISCHWEMFFLCLMRFDIQWHVLPGIKGITEVWRPFAMFILVCAWFSVCCSSCLIHLGKQQHHKHCLDYTYSYFF